MFVYLIGIIDTSLQKTGQCLLTVVLTNLNALYYFLATAFFAASTISSVSK